MFLLTILRRAFGANPRAIPVGPADNAALEARGIGDPVIRSYLVWRRSLMIVVVITTVGSAALSTYREHFETGERVDVLDSIAEHYRLNDQNIVLKLNEADDPEATEDEDDEVEEKQKALSAFGQFTDMVELAALYVLPIAALAVVLLWARFQVSFQILVAAFAFAFLVPLLIGFCPWSWWGYVEPAHDTQTHPWQFLQLQAEGVWEGMLYLVALLPTVISLVPGVQRACIRVKLLLPQSTLPGWFLVMASPFYALFLLVVFVAINQFHSHPLFFAGMLLLVLAPLCYAARARVFTRPLASEEDYRRITRVKGVVGAMTISAVGLLVAYLSTREVAGVHLLGLDYKHSLLVPLDVVEFVLEVISRSMFMTVLGADLFMRMNLAAWKNEREFAGSAAVASYDRVMDEFQRIA